MWSNNSAFRDFFIKLAAQAPFSAFRWETPPVTRTTVGRTFEFVLLDSPTLDRRVEASAFARHFDNANGRDVLTFANLGGDAIMVVPCPIGPDSAYGHLAAFIRSAPASQVHHLWQAVGNAMSQHLGDAPIWLSTAGMGVSWLHVRMDSRPKYYGYAPFKSRAY